MASLNFSLPTALDVDALHAYALQHYVPTISSYGYNIVSRDRTGIVLEWKRRPAVAIVAAILLFPIGLFFLLIKITDQIVITFHEATPGRADLYVQGTGPNSLVFWLDGIAPRQ